MFLADYSLVSRRVPLEVTSLCPSANLGMHPSHYSDKHANAEPLCTNSFSTVNTNLLTIPSTVGGMVSMMVLTLVSERLNDRSFVSMSEDVWLLPFLVALRTLPDNPNPWVFFVRFALTAFYLFCAYFWCFYASLCRHCCSCIPTRTRFKSAGALVTRVLLPLGRLAHRCIICTGSSSSFHIFRT